jgi:hypothetical protein
MRGYNDPFKSRWQPYYAVVFYYGIILKWEEIYSLFEYVEKFKPPPEKDQADGFDEGIWYGNILDEIDSYELIDEVAGLFRREGSSVRLESLGPLSSYEPPIPCLVIEETFHCVDGTRADFKLRQAAGEWDRQFKAACKTFELEWRRPEFHLQYSYYDYRNIANTRYRGEFFYGALIDDAQLEILLKNLLVDHRDILDEVGFDWDWWEWLLEKIVPGQVDAYHMACDEIDDGTKIKKIWDDLIVSTIQSREFLQWMPDAETYEHVGLPVGDYSRGIIDVIDKRWAAQGNAVGISAIDGDTARLFLYLRGTRHTIGYEDEGYFQDIPPIDEARAHTLFKEKCDYLGIIFDAPPTFHILRDDTPRL